MTLQRFVLARTSNALVSSIASSTDARQDACWATQWFSATGTWMKIIDCHPPSAEGVGRDPLRIAAVIGVPSDHWESRVQS